MRSRHLGYSYAGRRRPRTRDLGVDSPRRTDDARAGSQCRKRTSPPTLHLGRPRHDQRRQQGESRKGSAAELQTEHVHMLALRSIHIAHRRWTILPCRYSSSTPRGPFNVLFCGSDDFSIGSLRAVLDATGGLSQVRRQGSCSDVWKTVHVVTPAPQRTGRGGSRSKNKREEHKSQPRYGYLKRRS